MTNLNPGINTATTTTAKQLTPRSVNQVPQDFKIFTIKVDAKTI